MIVGITNCHTLHTCPRDGGGVIKTMDDRLLIVVDRTVKRLGELVRLVSGFERGC